MHAEPHRVVAGASVTDQTRAIEHWAAYWSAHDVARLLPLFKIRRCSDYWDMAPQVAGLTCLRPRVDDHLNSTWKRFNPEHLRTFEVAERDSDP